MEIKADIKFEVSYQNITFRNIKSGDKEKTDDYINGIYPNYNRQNEIARYE